ncbi:hypothetical protein FIBSPDRAFT_896282 [Athelia psychrophila]|uniref:Uncharacterized protein n=1 Tax=Athelia psychrophila TaxID=1759441 RepID=A0A166DJ46_9AGAM|nr:hypothetical protein FIBSPDRAFT_896282 [Fibularhizoctonia sp. CBS 109695]
MDTVFKVQGNGQRYSRMQGKDAESIDIVPVPARRAETPTHHAAATPDSSYLCFDRPSTFFAHMYYHSEKNIGRRKRNCWLDNDCIDFQNSLTQGSYCIADADENRTRPLMNAYASISNQALKAKSENQASRGKPAKLLKISEAKAGAKATQSLKVFKLPIVLG